jgi:glycosidase
MYALILLEIFQLFALPFILGGKTMPTWLNDAIFYEIYPQTFYDTNGDGIGDINGITEKLEYIKSIGCNAIWMNPCFDSPFMDAGYDVRDYKKVAARYGTNEDMKHCLEQAHKKGIRIILDLVPGHTSDQHEWFRQSQLAAQNEYTNRYIWTNTVWEKPKDFGCMTGMSERDGSYIINFFNSQPALNFGFNKITAKWQMHYTHPDCVATFDAILDVMRFWLDMGCDGFRVDMADSLVKNDPDKVATAELWRRARTMLDTEYPEAALVSEWSNPKQAITNAGFHGDFYLNHEGHGSGYRNLFRNTNPATGEQKSFFSKQGNGNINEFLPEYLERYNSSKDYGHICFFTCNHDTDRMSVSFDETELKISYAFIFTMPGMPFLYYGDEIGLQFFNLVSKEGGYRRTGSRTPMQWSKNKNLGFSTSESSKLYLPVDQCPCAPTVEGQLDDPNSILNTVKALIALRHSEPDLQADGEFEPIYAKENEYPFVYRRGKLLVAVNPSQNPAKAPVDHVGACIFSIGESLPDGDGIAMQGQSFAVFRMQP